MMFLPLAETMKLNEAIGISGLGFVIVLIVLAVLAVFVMLLSKILKKGKKSEKKSEPKSAPVETVVTAPKVTEDKAQAPSDFGGLTPVPGYVILDGISEQDAAVAMAITSHKTGIDLNRLQFNSIKRLNQNPTLHNIEEQDAAVVMAITCNKLGVEPENLIFNSIKLVED